MYLISAKETAMSNLALAQLQFGLSSELLHTISQTSVEQITKLITLNKCCFCFNGDDDLLLNALKEQPSSSDPMFILLSSL